jgi:hypothetical protein
MSVLKIRWFKATDMIHWGRGGGSVGVRKLEENRMRGRVGGLEGKFSELVRQEVRA